jgi:hypothetical protein
VQQLGAKAEESLGREHALALGQTSDFRSDGFADEPGLAALKQEQA